MTLCLKIVLIVFAVLIGLTMSIRFGVKLYRYLDNAINGPSTSYEYSEPTRNTEAKKKRLRDIKVLVWHEDTLLRPGPMGCKSLSDNFGHSELRNMEQ